MSPDEARAAFLWAITTPWEMYRAIGRIPPGERAEAVRVAADILGVSTRTIHRRVGRYWPVATEPQEPGSLHELRCEGPNSEAGCSCREVLIGYV